jgi:hypothetical protein
MDNFGVLRLRHQIMFHSKAGCTDSAQEFQEMIDLRPDALELLAMGCGKFFENGFTTHGEG